MAGNLTFRPSWALFKAVTRDIVKNLHIVEQRASKKLHFVEIDFKSAREKANLTLEEAASLAGYGVSTINALELENRGSSRLREKLIDVYRIKLAGDQVFQQVAPAIQKASIP